MALYLFFENIKNKIDIYDIPDSKKLHKIKNIIIWQDYLFLQMGILFLFTNYIFR